MAARALTLAALLCASPLFASEADALAISANIRAKHMPFGTILDPMYAASNSDQVIGYTRCGDSALWTGAYLAAESFRYKVQPSADALANVQAALAGLKSLADVTGDNRLARCIVPADSPFAVGIESEEAHNTVHQSPPFVWLDNTSRDEVVGAFFGLSIAYDFVDDPSVKGAAAALIGRLIGFVQKHQWSPNDDVANTYLLRPEELRMLIQVANHVNPANPISVPFSFLGVSDAVAFDITSLNSYFKFNLDYMSLYNLIRLQNSSENQNAYKVLRAFTVSHQNAFFDIIDNSIAGADAARDAEMRSLLDQWLQRPKRDVALIPATRISQSPVPVPFRPPTDFLWQRDPFQISGGGGGTIESPGIDYILPYWMGRYYGVIAGFTVQSAAAGLPALAPDSLASVYGTNLAPSVTLTDAAGFSRSASLLYASPQQINFVVPPDTLPGEAQIQIGAQTVAVNIQSVAPTLFNMAGYPVYVSGVPVYLSFYGTGIRHRAALSDVSILVNGLPAPVLYAGPAPGYQGLDQINIQLPPSLQRSGTVTVMVADGAMSNASTISIQ